MPVPACQGPADAADAGGSPGFSDPADIRSSASPLAWLLAPVPVQAFLDELWGAAPHHISRDRAEYFGPLTELATAEGLLTALRAASAGRPR